MAMVRKPLERSGRDIHCFQLDILPEVIIRNGKHYHPYRRPQAAATSADLKPNNMKSTDAALTGGVQSDGAGGTTSSRNRATQLAAVPFIVPSHTHTAEGASTTDQQVQVRTGDWKNAELEKNMLQIARDALDAMAFGRGDRLKCSFVYAAHNGAPSRPCGMTFVTKTLRDRHAKGVHLETLLKQCEFCVKPFSRPDSTLRHIQAKEPVCPVLEKWKEAHGEIWLKVELESKGYKLKEK
ncbi:hypothetical protein PENSPDRAFT_94134 [Peniophora sp. CONT]|nr:hypothetical protein PENSPDRAFT_94134 [Peniophora sp. CONT]